MKRNFINALYYSNVMRNAIILLLLLLIPLAQAAIPSQQQNTPDPYSLREQQVIESIQAENKQTREYIRTFGEETNAMYHQERLAAEKEINSILVTFKFTLAITIFCAILAALETHNLLKKRREKKYRPLTVADAEKMQEKPPLPPPPSELKPPSPPPHLDTRKRWDI